MKYLIVGLGNPGPEYELTRHNIGFLVLDALAEKLDTTFSLSRQALKSEGKYKGRTLHLIKPTTFMNLSGKALNFWMKELKIGPEQVLVITDDLALPFGKLRMRAKGSSGGHNGLKDIERVLGGQKYPRIRFGVGSDFGKGQQVDYVLSNFPQEELDGLPPLIDRAMDMTLGFATIGIDRTMNQHND
ncbi:MAG: aminoacyl-tRNA hydrolase [Bacteroidota bacterium]